MDRIEVFRGGRRLVDLVAAPQYAGGRNEFVVSPQGFSGWPAPSVKREQIERQSAHGSFHMPTFYGDSVMTVEGHALAVSSRELGQMRLELMRCFGEPVRVQVADELGTLWAEASLAEAPSFETMPTVGERTEAKFSLLFWLPDPWKYGPSLTVPISGYSEVVSRGEQPSWPIIRVNGPATNFAVEANGRRKSYSLSLSGSQWVELDTRRDSTVTNAGVRVQGIGLPPFLLPGVNQVRISGASGSVTHADTFI